jgi:hypothetical protein
VRPTQVRARMDKRAPLSARQQPDVLPNVGVQPAA